MRKVFFLINVPGTGSHAMHNIINNTYCATTITKSATIVKLYGKGLLLMLVLLLLILSESFSEVIILAMPCRLVLSSEKSVLVVD